MDLLALPRAGAAAAFGLGSAVRGARVLHPRGSVHTCRLVVHGGGDWGSTVLDAPATYDGVVRVSRSLGLPEPLPDVDGLALRLPGLGVGGRPLDVLVVSALRFVFVPSVLVRTWSSILPFRTRTGRLVLLGARPRPHGFELLVTTLGGRWQHWGDLHTGSPAVGDLRTAPTVGADDLVPVRLFRALRAWSYTASQSAR